MILRAVRSGKWHAVRKIKKFIVFGISESLDVESIVIVRAVRSGAGMPCGRSRSLLSSE